MRFSAAYRLQVWLTILLIDFKRSVSACHCRAPRKGIDSRMKRIDKLTFADTYGQTWKYGNRFVTSISFDRPINQGRDTVSTISVTVSGRSNAKILLGN